MKTIRRRVAEQGVREAAVVIVVAMFLALILALFLTGCATTSNVGRSKGPVTTTWSYGTPWVDPGGTVTDNYDGVAQGTKALTWEDVRITQILFRDPAGTVVRVDTISTVMLGTYTIYYQVSDSSGNIGTATRYVKVKDITPPVITAR